MSSKSQNLRAALALAASLSGFSASYGTHGTGGGSGMPPDLARRVEKRRRKEKNRRAAAKRNRRAK